MHKENGFNIDEWLWDEFNLSGVFYGQTIDDGYMLSRLGNMRYALLWIIIKNTYMTQATIHQTCPKRF